MIKLTIEERCKMFVEKKWSYDPITGIIYSHMNNPVKDNLCRFWYKPLKDFVQISKHTLAWYLMTGHAEERIYHKDSNLKNMVWSNLTTLYIFKPKYKRPNRKPSKKIETVTNIQKEPIKRGKYLSEQELTYEIKISLGKGKLTKNAELMLVKMSTEIIKKFSYRNEADEFDCRMGGLYQMLIGWRSFNSEKYDSAFPFLSEIAKRGIAKAFNELIGKQKYTNELPKFVSISNIYNF
jgi:hypothetical protein